MRPYVKRRSAWVERVMTKYFADWPDYDEQVSLFDLRGYDEKTVRSVGVMFFTRLMPRADVIAIRDNELLIVELDHRMELLHVSRLKRYVDAIKHDEARPDWRRRKVVCAYVTSGYDVRIENECQRLGFRYIVEPEPGVT